MVGHCAVTGHWLFSIKVDTSCLWSISCPKGKSFGKTNNIPGYCNLWELFVRLLCKTIAICMWMQKCSPCMLQDDEWY